MENDYKCSSCGANMKHTEKYCSYCDSPNKNYIQPEVKKTAKPQQNEDDDIDIDSGLGGFLGGVVLGGILNGLTRGPRGPRPPMGPRSPHGGGFGKRR